MGCLGPRVLCVESLMTLIALNCGYIPYEECCFIRTPAPEVLIAKPHGA